MYALIVSPENEANVKAAIGDTLITYERVGKFFERKLLEHFKGAIDDYEHQVLIIDTDCAFDIALIKGIKEYKQQRDSRIIVIAVGREPGDQTIKDLVKLNIFDFVSPSPGELVDEEIEGEAWESIHSDELTNWDSEYNLQAPLSHFIKKQLKHAGGITDCERWLVEAIQPSGSEDDQDEEEPTLNSESILVAEPAELNTDFMVKEEIQSPVGSRSFRAEPIVGSRAVTIVIGGAERRTGTTHSAMRISKFLSLQYSVACVELIDEKVSPPVFFAFENSVPTKNRIKDGFHYEGIDFFPNVNLQKYIELCSAGYQYVVVDVGTVVYRQENKMNLGAYAQELFRSDIPLITTTAAIWDFVHMVSSMDALWSNGWKRPTNILVNLCDQESFRNLSQVFKKKERESLQIQFIEHSYQVNPFENSDEMGESYLKLLSEYLPNGKKKKRMFSKLFG